MTTALGVDLYQLTSLVPHAEAGLLEAPVVFDFFSRRLPTGEGPSHGPARPFLLQSMLGRSLETLSSLRFSPSDLAALDDHPLLGPALLSPAGRQLRDSLERWRFEGEIRAPLDGSLLLSGPTLDTAGRPVEFNRVRPSAYVPYLSVKCSLLSAKLIETPLLSLINHGTMVATKAALVAAAARHQGRGVLEFGTRRVHPDAAVDAARAAYLAGCSGTSNVEAWRRFGVPCVGTMDHFAVQAWERSDLAVADTERAFFAALHRSYPGQDIHLVDTYDPFGADTGIRAAVAATDGKLAGIRLDSNVDLGSIAAARGLLDSLGAHPAKIVVSSGLDEVGITALAKAPVDLYGVGERIVCSPDAPTGVGAVAKLSEIGGKPTMKLSRGSDKASLPGRLQAWRTPDDRIHVGLADETPPPDGEPLLQRVWSGRAPSTDRPEAVSRVALEEARQRAVQAIDHERPTGLALTASLIELIRRLDG